MLQKGDLIFIDSGTFNGKVVKKVTNFHFSHISIYMGEGKILDIDFFKQSKIRDITELQVRHFSIKRLIEQERFVDLSKIMTGFYYDYTGVFKMFLNTKGFKFKRQYNDRLWCSELVDEYFKCLGINLTNKKREEFVSIEDIYRSKHLKDVHIEKLF